MRKYAANYLVSDTGVFLKNGMAIVRTDGSVVQYVDTGGDLREVEQLSFHNGILIAGFRFSRTKAGALNLLPDNLFGSMVLQLTGEVSQLPIQDHLDLAKELQVQFPQMKIPALLNEMENILLIHGGFYKEIIPGLHLLTGLDLVHLHFTSRSRVKKII